MRKIFIIFFFNFIFCNIGSAESYYFKECKLNEALQADYTIDINKKVINVVLKTSDGQIQEWIDEIQAIQQKKIITKKIISGAGENRYFVYYLDKDSESIIKQEYKKQSGIDLFIPDGPKKQSFCANVKADWDKNKIQDVENSKEQEQILKAQEKILKKQKSIVRCKGNNHKEWTNCYGSYQTETALKYTGEFKNGKILEGTALYPGGSKYVGGFKDNKPHGQGTFVYSDGSQYFGEWSDGKNNGNGTKIWNDGKKYSGKFKDDKPHGQGTFTSPSGEKYVGEYKNGKRHGQGTLKYSDGTTYVGKFVAGLEHGDGTCIDQDGSSVACTILRMGKKDSSVEKNRRDILISGKKWIKLSKYKSGAGEKLKNDFNKKASELCSNGNFDTLEQKIVVLEMDETPAFGIETVVKIGVEGVVECK